MKKKTSPVSEAGAETDILAVGEVLYDIMGASRRLGGAPCNFAVHCRGLGIKTQLLTRVGNDPSGKNITDFLVGRGFDRSLIQIDPHRPTGEVQVSTGTNREPCFLIEKNAAYDHISLTDNFKTEPGGFFPRLLYFGTLIQRSSSGAMLIDRLAGLFTKKCPMFCDLNLRAGHFVFPRIIESLKICSILKLNLEELKTISETLRMGADKAGCLKNLAAMFDIDLIALTAGSRGGMVLFQDQIFPYSATPVTRIKNSVGAGDAFAAMLAVGYLKGMPISETISRASIFAAAVCGLPGAIPDSTVFYRSFLIKERR